MRFTAWIRTVSGWSATEFSDISPTSKTRVGFLDLLADDVSTSAQNSRFSVRDTSAPDGLSDVRIERHRRPVVVSPVFQWALLFGSLRKPRESGNMVIQS